MQREMDEQIQALQRIEFPDFDTITRDLSELNEIVRGLGKRNDKYLEQSYQFNVCHGMNETVCGPNSSVFIVSY